jgi:hypothetical protein
MILQINKVKVNRHAGIPNSCMTMNLQNLIKNNNCSD